MKHGADRERTRARDCGQILVIFALGLIVMLAAAAVAVDVGYWLSEKRALQNAADAAAQAGTSELLKRPITSTKNAAAAQHAMAYVDSQLGLGLRAAALLDCASVAAADPLGDGFGPEDCPGYAGATRVTIRTPVLAGQSCRGVAWGSRAVTVRIERPSSRFFSRILFPDDLDIGVCATSAVNGGSMAIAVLKPNHTGPNTYETQPNNATITMKLAGSDTFIRVWGGDVGINSMFSAAGAPPPSSPNQPAYLKFMTAAGTGISDNRMLATIENPSPITWSVVARQIRTEGLTTAEADDVYHEPRHLPSYIPIPGWGDTRYAALVAADGTTAPVTLDKGTPSSGTTCTDPVTGLPGVDPGKYDLIGVDTAGRRWLCPGVFHFVHRNGTEGLQLASNAAIAGQGVTLVFDSDSEIRIDSGGSLLLDSAAAGGTQLLAPWRTDAPAHDVPIAIWIQPVPACDPLAVACNDNTASDVFVMAGGAGMDIRGIIYGPTDKMTISGNNAHHGSGEIWAWTLTYAGNSVLDQVYEGSDDGYALLVE
jgi:hypothetical protein